MPSTSVSRICCPNRDCASHSPLGASVIGCWRKSRNLFTDGLALVSLNPEPTNAGIRCNPLKTNGLRQVQQQLVTEAPIGLDRRLATADDGSATSSGHARISLAISPESHFRFIVSAESVSKMSSSLRLVLLGSFRVPQPPGPLASRAVRFLPAGQDQGTTGIRPPPELATSNCPRSPRSRCRPHRRSE